MRIWQAVKRESAATDGSTETKKRQLALQHSKSGSHSSCVNNNGFLGCIAIALHNSTILALYLLPVSDKYMCVFRFYISVNLDPMPYTIQCFTPSYPIKVRWADLP